MWRAQRYNPAAQQQRQVTPFIYYMRFTCPRYLCCGKLLVSDPIINNLSPHHTIPHVSAVLPLWVRVSIDAET